MTVKVTQFRQNLFQYLDQCRESGQVLLIERGKEIYRLTIEKKRLPINALPRRPWKCVCDSSLPDPTPYNWHVDDLS